MTGTSTLNLNLNLTLNLNPCASPRLTIFLYLPSLRVRPNQSNQHRYDFDKNNFAFFSNYRFNTLPGDKHIETCGTFKGGTSRRVKVAAAIRRGELPVAFGDIERDGSCRTVQLIMDGQSLRCVGKRLRRPRHESDGGLVDGQFLVVELPHGSEGRKRQKAGLRLRVRVRLRGR